MRSQSLVDQSKQKNASADNSQRLLPHLHGATFPSYPEGPYVPPVRSPSPRICRARSPRICGGRPPNRSC